METSTGIPAGSNSLGAFRHRDSGGLFYYLGRRSGNKDHCRALAEQTRKTEEAQKACEALRQTQQVVMQEERLRALGQMASGFAHDINNALCPLLCYADMVLSTETSLSRESREYIKHIAKAAENIAQIVTRTRAFYRRRSDTELLFEVNLVMKL